ncbi:MAG: glycine cleavage system aminomethyltransferase GcvT [Acholeplasmataceae bacterium]|nr:glycine cleavage system aminomethyltransferase GcvT [Acholeplasmataceae bacterium]
MKKTALYKKHLSLNAKMIEYAGYEMPVSYTGITEEHLAVRNSMGIFDVSHMGEFIVEGKDALRFVNHLVTNLVVEETGKVTYALMCDEQGFVVDDLLVYVIELERILLVVNAGNMEKDYEWVLLQSKSFDVTLKNKSDDLSQVAIQGPRAADFINQILGSDVNSLKFMTFSATAYQDLHVIVSRTGYTGEDGFEIYGQPQYVAQIWDDAIKFGAIPCGLGARDTLRFEANLPLYGHEISESINPVEAGLNFAIKLDKPFIGRDALVAYKEHPKRKVVGIELLEKNIPRHGYEVYAEDRLIGHITTGYLLPNVDTPIACALIDIEYAKIGTELAVQIRRNKVPAKVRNRKFYIKNYIK